MSIGRRPQGAPFFLLPPSGEGRDGGAPALDRRMLLRAGAATGLALALPPLRAAEIQQLAPSTPLPPFQAFDMEGRKVAVPLPGRASVVNFWASWCVPCRTEMPLLQQLADLYGDKLALQLVNFKERAVAVQRHVQAAAWTQPVLLDPLGEGAAAWGVKVFPTTLGFDAQGRPRWRVRGEYDWSSAEAGRLVEGLWR
ncbi:MAG: TlpA family protein disulfide reductase [Ramlibacter sp.]|jgi:thiol-disulfide isomerase/thioredoxin|nr:TlpA family protein disulfide reductase [Ramlibacter sp.]